MVSEQSADGLVVNQPAGHWEDGESLLEAVVRETREETAWHFVPRGLVGCYQWQVPGTDKTYLRFCFYGEVEDHDAEQTLDAGIVSADWWRVTDLRADDCPKRSPLVLRCLDDYLAGQHYPLDFLQHIRP